jgi:pimeloyl-ACP methyl ester carboxylesterase
MADLWRPRRIGRIDVSFFDVLRPSFPDFDLILPDHRGTGFSGRLCPQEVAVDRAARHGWRVATGCEKTR